ncbi:MAG: triose-phosphate isomerase [Rhodobacteraceae bacterium]|nr:triose-phosphate isomerase [Paracoccaceae bacterium]
MRRKLAAGNWKMNGLMQTLAEVETLHTAHPAPRCDIVVCPPATLMCKMAEICAPMAIEVGAQDCHENEAGAHTGDISAPMIADTGARYVILGHSERRAAYGESDALVCAKTRAVWAAGLTAIVCIGETSKERDAGNTLDIVGRQLAGSVPDGACGSNTVIAYEPVWAIGTGKTPSLAKIAEVHNFIRSRLTNRCAADGDAIRILYGGSMTPRNVEKITAVTNVDGGLVGGASLKAADFGAIVATLGK